MKSTIAILFLAGLLTNLDYSFDYRLEYEIKSREKDTVQIANYYVNSKSNDFYADIRIRKKGGFEFYFRDQDTLTAQAILTGDYKNPGTIVLRDSMTRHFGNSYDYKSKQYDIVPLKDTVIVDKSYARVLFRMIDAKKAKRKKIASAIYVIDTSRKMKPLLADPAILNISRLRRNMPDGLVIEKQVYDSKGKLSWTEKLKEIAPVNFNLLIREY